MKRILTAALGLALLAFVKPYDVGAVDAPHSNTCSDCHKSSVQPDSGGFNSNCLTCHSPTSTKKPGTEGVTSHKWSGPDENLAKGAQHPAPTSALHNVTAYTGNTLACVSCHDPHKNGTPDGYADFLRVNNSKDSLCLDCHRSRNVQRNNTSGSHPVFIGYSTTLRTKGADFKAIPADLNTRLTASGNMVLCSTCHGTHNVANAGNLTTPGVGGGDLLLTNPRGAAVPPGEADKLSLCTNCHANKFNHNAKKMGDNGQDIQCNDCHGAHVNDVADTDHGINQKLVRRTLSGNKVYFADGENFNSGNGVCQACHSSLPTSVPNHSASQGCRTCHNHSNPSGSFSVGNLTCTTCHGNPPTTTKLGVSTYTHTSSTCSDCHSVPSSAIHSNGVIEILTNNTACASCHAYPPSSASHASAVGGTTPNCATSCHTYTGFNGTTHNNGMLNVNAMTCSSCHGNPPATVSHSGYTAGSCAACHGYLPADSTVSGSHRNGTTEFSCTGCHGNPPTTSYHSGVTTGTCATCHGYLPTAVTVTGNHRNGTVEVLENSNACASCHGYPPATHTAYSATTTDISTCTACHIYTGYKTDTHKNGTKELITSLTPTLANAHFNTAKATAGSYATSRSSCSDCHNNNSDNLVIRQQWSASGHASVTSPPFASMDFKTRAVCVRCHTTTGFVNYSGAHVTTAWGVAADTTKEVITCRACHSDVANGVVRDVTPAYPFSSNTGFQNAELGKSNVCADCHSGRDSGTAYVATVSDLAKAFKYNSHYLPAAGTLQGATGYAFSGRTYTALTDNSHRTVGSAADGPCVGCHMSSPNKHAFSVISSSSVDGKIKQIYTNACATCHTYNTNNTMTADALDSKRVTFNNALEVLRIALAEKGFNYANATFTFNGVTTWGNKNTYGAAYNYRMFVAEPGAYAHNPEYARQLITDSIDAVYNNGTVTGDITSALSDLLTNNKISQLQYDSITGYKSATASCNSCHSTPPASVSHASATTSPLNCANCHIYTGMAGATHNNGTVDFGTMTCTSCHGTLSSSHAVHVGNLPSLVNAYGGTDTSFMNNNTDSTGYKFGCVTCHPSTNDNHKNGTIVLNGNGFAGTTKSNITCATASCHSDGKGKYTVTPNWYTGFTGPDKCAMCHAAAPTTGAHTAHINNGIHEGSSGITYETTLSCAKCHANTVDSSKKISYLNHINGVVNVAFVAANEVSKAQISAASFNAYSTVWTRTGATDTSKKFLSAGSYTGGTCSTIACHNNGTTPAWGSGSLSCVACHSNL